MNKLQMAHDWAMKIIEGNMRAADASDLVERAWQYADAMQAEADKRIDTSRPESLCGVDWSQAPEDCNGWAICKGFAVWFFEDCIMIAPSFGFTGTHIVERPHGK